MIKIVLNTANESGLFHGASFHPEYMDLNGHHGRNHLHDHHHHIHHAANGAGAGTDDADEAAVDAEANTNGADADVADFKLTKKPF